MARIDDLRSAFMAGVEWWASVGTGLSEFSRGKAYEEAKSRYGDTWPPLEYFLVGTWAADDLRRIFVDGAAWYEWHNTDFTMWNSDRRLAEAEAERRYPGGQMVGVG